jgi:predicted nucleic acid-binding protein
MKRIVIDANILIRAILGVRVAGRITQHATKVQFLTTEIAFLEAKKHLPTVLQKRGADVERIALCLLDLKQLKRGVIVIPTEIISPFEPEARRRLLDRDQDDWHLLALCLGLETPLWTEDNDFFGVGITTWKSALIDIFLT